MHANLSPDIIKLVQSLSIVVIEDNSFTKSSSACCWVISA